MTRSPPRRALRRLWCGPVVAVWVTLLVLMSRGGLAVRWQELLLCGVTEGAAAACWARVLALPESRLTWSLFALGLTAYGAGFVVLFFVSMGEGGGPFGLNVSDSVSFLLYPCTYGALALLTRSRTVRWSRGALLDGLVVLLAAWAVALSWISAASPGLLQGGTREVLYALAYPVFGFTLLAIALTGLVLTRSRPDGVWLLLVLGFAAWTVGDAVYAARSAADTFHFGTSLDAVYAAGPVLVALAAWTRPRHPPRAPRASAAVMAVPAVATLAALAVLVDRSPALPATAVRLAAGVVVLAVTRTAVFVRQERLLAQRTQEARTDELTGLTNRRGLLLALDARLAGGRSGALPRVELDRFSEVNQALGHSAGDRLLVELARRLRSELPDAVVARLSGSGFAVVLDLDPDTDPEATAARRLSSGWPAGSRCRSVSTGATSPWAARPASRPGGPSTDRRPASSCAGPMSRCTWPSSVAPVRRSGAVATTRTPASSSASSPTSPPPWSRRTRFPCTCSPSATRARARSGVPRRWCAGSTRGAGWCTRRLHRRGGARRVARRPDRAGARAVAHPRPRSSAPPAARSRSRSTSVRPTCWTRASPPAWSRRCSGTGSRPGCCASRSPRRW